MAYHRERLKLMNTVAHTFIVCVLDLGLICISKVELGGLLLITTTTVMLGNLFLRGYWQRGQLGGNPQGISGSYSKEASGSACGCAVREGITYPHPGEREATPSIQVLPFQSKLSFGKA